MIICHFLMTCTSLVWNLSRNWIQITKNFQNHFQIPKDFQNHFWFNMESGNFQNCFKWWIDSLGLQDLAQRGYLLNKMTCKTCQMMQQPSDYMIYQFWKFPDLIWNMKLISKNFRNPKMILKIFVIPIQFQNWFQTIEV